MLHFSHGARYFIFEVLYRERDCAYLEFVGAGLRMLEEPGRHLCPDGKPRVAVHVDVPDGAGLDFGQPVRHHVRP